MPLFDGRVKYWSERRRNIEDDLDDWYEEIKKTHAVFIQVGKLGYDDRTKLFHMSIQDGWNEWIILTYNQNRIMLHCARGTLFAYNSNRPCAEPIEQPSWTLASQMQIMQNQMNNMYTQLQNMQAMLDGRPPTMGPTGTGWLTGRPRSSTGTGGTGQ